MFISGHGENADQMLFETMLGICKNCMDLGLKVNIGCCDYLCECQPIQIQNTQKLNSEKDNHSNVEKNKTKDDGREM